MTRIWQAALVLAGLWLLPAQGGRSMDLAGLDPAGFFDRPEAPPGLVLETAQAGSLPGFRFVRPDPVIRVLSILHPASRAVLLRYALIPWQDFLVNPVAGPGVPALPDFPEFMGVGPGLVVYADCHFPPGPPPRPVQPRPAPPHRTPRQPASWPGTSTGN